MRLGGTYAKSRMLATGKTVYVRLLRGQLIACKWPKKRPRVTHPTTLDQMERFRQANWLAKYAPAPIQMAHRRLVDGTQLLPRDLMVAAMLGRGMFPQLPGELRRYPVAAIRDLSDTLDILGAKPSDILARGGDRWQAISPTQPGQIPVSGAVGDAPSWQTITPGSGVWQQIQDKTLAANLGINVYEDVVIPAGVNKIEFDLLCPAASFQVIPALRLNGLATSIYNSAIIYTSSATNVTATTSAAAAQFGFFHSSQAVANNLMHIFGQLLLRAVASTVMLAAQGITGVPRTAQTTGFATLPAGAKIDKISFAGLTGSGLPAGTRIVVRGAIP